MKLLKNLSMLIGATLLLNACLVDNSDDDNTSVSSDSKNSSSDIVSSSEKTSSSSSVSTPSSSSVSSSSIASSSSSTKLVGADLIENTWALGAENNAAAGSFDLDEMKSYTFSTSMANQEKIDLFYAVDPYDNTEYIYNPQAAYYGGFGGTSTGPKNWDYSKLAECPIMVVPAGTYESINSYDKLDELYQAFDSDLEVEETPISTNSEFLVLSSEDILYLIKVTNQVLGSSGKISVKSLSFY